MLTLIHLRGRGRGETHTCKYPAEGTCSVVFCAIHFNAACSPAVRDVDGRGVRIHQVRVLSGQRTEAHISFFLSFWRGERDSENTESGGVEGAFLFYSDIEIARTEEKQAIYGYDVTANHPRRPCMGVPNCPAVIAPGQTPCPRSPTTAPRRERERERKTKNAFYEQPSPPLRPPPPPLTSASASQTPPNPPSSQHPAQTSSAHPSRPQTPRAPKIPPAPPAACSA